MISTLFALILAAAAAPAAAPAATPPPAAEAPPGAGETLGFLAGSWRGTGWIQMGRERHTFDQTERVAPLLDGAVMLIEGKGVDPADAGTVHHHAFAVLSPAAAPGAYEFRSYAAGRAGTFPARLDGPGKLVWEIEAPNRRIRYVIQVTGDRWVEDGMIKLGEGDWQPFFHMTLDRVGPASF